jgi:hypothetical protein
MIELPDDVYQRVEEAAAAAGTTPAAWVAAQLPKPVLCSNGAKPPARTLADEFAGYIGVFDGPSDLSERASELFAEGMLEKQRNATL